MSPTVVWNDAGKTLAMGSPGASRITTTIFKGWQRFADENMGFQATVRASRLHVECVDDAFTLQHEPGVDVGSCGEAFRLRPVGDIDMYFGALNVAGREENGKLHTFADSRRHGSQLLA